MENNNLPKIILSGGLSAGFTTEEHQRSNTRTAWENPLVPVTSNITDDSPLLRVENHDAWCPTTKHCVTSPPLNTSTGLFSRTRGSGRGTAALCHQALTWPSVAAATTVSACTISAMNWSLLDLRFKKPNHNDKYTHTHTHTQPLAKMWTWLLIKISYFNLRYVPCS